MTEAPPSFAPAWVEYPMARFTMGCDDPQAPADEGPTRLVTVGSLAISPPVTVEQWSSFADATGYHTIAETEGSSFATCIDPGRPVPGLDWWTDGQAAPSEAVRHVAWLDAWEFCRWADVRLPTEAEWARVASAEAAATRGGLWVWCDDWYSPDHFRDEQRVNPTGPNSGTHRVARAGGRRLTARAAVLPDLSASDLGFRVVRRR